MPIGLDDATRAWKRVFITGASGFMGAALAARYRAAGVEVRGVDLVADLEAMQEGRITIDGVDADGEDAELQDGLVTVLDKLHLGAARRNVGHLALIGLAELADAPAKNGAEAYRRTPLGQFFLADGRVAHFVAPSKRR